MARAPKILAFAGSARRESFNGALLRAAAARLEALGATVTALELASLDLPFYNGDMEREQGLPAGARRFKALLRAHDALLVATPEYNGGYTPLLKNALDWGSRAEAGETPVAAYAGLAAGLVGASPGGRGVARSLALTRQLLTNLGVSVVGEQFGLGGAGGAFDEAGGLKAAGHRAALDSAAEALVRAAREAAGAD